MKKKTKLFLLFLGIFLGIGIFLIGAIQSMSLINIQSFSLVGESAYLPRYWTAECISRNAPETKEITTHTDTGTFYACNTNQAGTYIPLNAGVQCIFNPYDFSNLVLYLCDIQYDVNGKIIDGVPTSYTDKRCVKKVGIFEFTAEGLDYEVPAGDYIYIDTDKVFGDAKLKATFPSYGLRVRSKDGLVNPTTNSCEIKSISNQGLHTVDKGDRVIIQPNVPMNAVTGLELAHSTQLVRLPNVENGEIIYISRAGFYNKVLRAEDGFLYVHTELGEFSNPSIECIPRTTGCSDDAKAIKITEQSCDLFGGAINNYAPVQGDISKLCKYSCSAGKLQLTNDCIKIAQSCPTNEPLWDTSTGKCTAVKDTTETKEPKSYWGLALVLGGAVLIYGLTTPTIQKGVKP